MSCWCTSKKKILDRILLLLFSVLCFVSCEFSTNEVYDRDIKEDIQPPEISVINLTLENDTVFLFDNIDNVRVTFCFSSSNNKILAVKFLIDGVDMKTVYSESGDFEYDLYYLNEGIHKLDIQIITGSGSRSIADILGMEGFVFYKSWTLVVDKSYNVPLNSTIVNGLLQFSWKKYPDNDFIGYVIYRENSSYIKTEVGNTTSQFFTDSTYVGEGGTYEVRVRKKNGDTLPWGYLHLQKDMPKISLTETESGIYMVTWDESKYFNAVDSCYLYIRYNNYSDFVKVKSADNQSDYSYLIDDAYFNSAIIAKIVLVQKKNILYDPERLSLFESSHSSIRIGRLYNTIGYFVGDLFQSGPDEFAFSSYNEKLARYSVSGKKIVASITTPGCTSAGFINLASSSSGKFSTSYNLCGYQVTLVSSGSLQDNIISDLKPFSGQQYVPSIPVSDIKTAIVNRISGGFYIYDFKTSSSLALKEVSGGSCEGLKISTGGNYIFLRDDSLRLVKFENSLFSAVWSHNRFDYNLKVYDFHGLNPDQLVIWDGATFSVRLCSDFSTVYEFPLTDQNIQSIDYYNNRMLTYSPGHLYVRNLTDGSLIKDVPIFFDPLDYYNSCILTGGAIVCKSGYLYYYE